MSVSVSLYSKKENEIYNFLNRFKENTINDKTVLKWSKDYKNPIELADIIGVFIDNRDSFDINMWVNLDEGFYMNVTSYNADKLIRYLFERYPY